MNTIAITSLDHASASFSFLLSASTIAATYLPLPLPRSITAVNQILTDDSAALDAGDAHPLTDQR